MRTPLFSVAVPLNSHARPSALVTLGSESAMTISSDRQAVIDNLAGETLSLRNAQAWRAIGDALREIDQPLGARMAMQDEVWIIRKLLLKTARAAKKRDQGFRGP